MKYPDIGSLSFVAMRDGKTLPKPKGNQAWRCFWNVKGPTNARSRR